MAQESCKKYDFIAGLYSFTAAVSILRLALLNGELETHFTPHVGEKEVKKFFSEVASVERSLREGGTTAPRFSLAKIPPVRTTVIAIEGLDGSGKSSLVGSLQAKFESELGCSANIMKAATPTRSMEVVRGIFDGKGGPVARAFYQVSNYILQYEITQVEDEMNRSQRGKHLIFIVDRWYASTVAYSCAWKNTDGAASDIDRLKTIDPGIFCWPKDLRKPDILLLLSVDDEVRRQRVIARNSGCADGPNPWDRRLNNDPQLAQRIWRALALVGEELKSSSYRSVSEIDGNESRQEVVEQAAALCMKHWKHCPLDILDAYSDKPLELYKAVVSDLGLCEPETGKRTKHAPWAIQLATICEPKDQTQAPCLKSVGVHSLCPAGLNFFMRRDEQRQTLSPASICWVGGEYPYEQQWRGEGLIVPIGWNECSLLSLEPPPSLVAYTTASQQFDLHGTDKAGALSAKEADVIHAKAQELRSYRPSEDAKQKALQGWRFVPLRLEVLAGGPSSPGGFNRLQWTREVHSNGTGWRSATHTLPFRVGACPTSLNRGGLKNMTVAVTGSHCSGKTTLVRRLSRLFDATLHPELGDVLRSAKTLVEGGHRSGDGTGSQSANSWDERLFLAECERDCHADSPLRFVETWHLGNLEWALLRKELDGSLTSTEQWKKKVQDAIREEAARRVVLWIHLSVEPEDSLRRRSNVNEDGSTAKSRLPMKREQDEVQELHGALHRSLLSRNLHPGSAISDLKIPLLEVHNSHDGEDAIEEVMRKIVDFMNEDFWKRAL